MTKQEAASMTQQEAASETLHSKIMKLTDAEYKVLGENLDYFLPDTYARIKDIEEFTDIKWAAVQSLLNWANETDEPFQQCVKKFLREFRAELANMKAQGVPEKRGAFYMRENWRFHFLKRVALKP